MKYFTNQKKSIKLREIPFATLSYLATRATNFFCNNNKTSVGEKLSSALF